MNITHPSSHPNQHKGTAEGGVGTHTKNEEDDDYCKEGKQENSPFLTHKWGTPVKLCFGFFHLRTP